MTPTPHARIFVRFFVQSIALLVVYALAALLAALKFLSAEDPLLTVLPYSQTAALASSALLVAALTGLVAGGLYIANQGRLIPFSLLHWANRLWLVLGIATVAAGLLGWTEGRAQLELHPILDVLLLVALALAAVAAMPALRRSAIVQVWMVGLALAALAAGIGLLPAADGLQDRVFGALAAGLIRHAALPLMALALGYWLMHRFSNLTPGWVEQSLPVTAGLLAVAAALVTLSTLPGAPAITRTLALLAPVLLLIVAAHCYRALSDRHPNTTLAAHWFTLSLLLLLVGIGLLGGLLAVPEIRAYTLGTRLSDVQSTLALLAGPMLALGVFNQAAAELRGENRRVTGLVPFWLAAFGLLASALALAAAGIVQVYLERTLSVGYLETQTLLIPLYGGWVAGLAVFGLGLLVFGLTFWLRRPARR